MRHINKTSALPALITAGLLIAIWPCNLAAQGQITEQKLVPNDVASGHFTGHSVAVRGQIAVVGAYRADTGATDSGAAYVFELVGNSWTQTAKLVADTPGFTAEFGSSVAVDDNGTILVGAAGQDSARGAAFVFEKIAGAWTQTASLTASDRAAGDNFGFATTIDGDTLMVGAWGRNGVRGATYVYQRSNGTWQETATLIPNDVAGFDYFGYTVSIEGDLAVIGSPADDDLGRDSGSAYIYNRVAGVWTQGTKLLASDGATSDFLARTSSISNGTIVLGARDSDDLGMSSGSAYVYELQSGAWAQTAKLLPNDGGANDIFGHSVAISGDRIVVGAKWRDDNGSQSGAAYLFERSAGAWTQTTRLNASDAGAGDAFGESVAASGRVILVGAWRNSATRGAAYLYQQASPVDPDQSSVTSGVANMPASRGSTTILVTPKRSDGSLVGAGLVVEVRVTGGTLVGPANDNGDGTYTQLLEASGGSNPIVASAIADGVALNNTATIILITVSAETSMITVDPKEITAGQSATVTVTPKDANGNNVGRGQTVVITTSLGKLNDTVRDNLDGTYTQRLDTAGAGTADVGASVNGIDLINRTALIVKPQIIGDVVGFRADSTSVVYRTIQQAVRHATRDQVVRIVVAPGNYDEVVRIYRHDGLRLETIPTLGLTTIRGLRIWSSRNITVDGFDVDASRSWCSGIAMHYSSGIAVRNCMVRNARHRGMTVGFRCSDVVIDQCMVENSRREGIRVRSYSRDIRILRTTVRGNRTGIHISRRAQVRIEGCTITDNGNTSRGCYARGYGVFAQRVCRRQVNPTLITLIHNTITGNRGREIAGRSDANFGNHDQFIDATDDQAPFNK